MSQRGSVFAKDQVPKSTSRPQVRLLPNSCRFLKPSMSSNILWPHASKLRWLPSTSTILRRAVPSLLYSVAYASTFPSSSSSVLYFNSA